MSDNSRTLWEREEERGIRQVAVNAVRADVSRMTAGAAAGKFGLVAGVSPAATRIRTAAFFRAADAAVAATGGIAFARPDHRANRPADLDRRGDCLPESFQQAAPSVCPGDTLRQVVERSVVHPSVSSSGESAAVKLLCLVQQRVYAPNNGHERVLRNFVPAVSEQ